MYSGEGRGVIPDLGQMATVLVHRETEEPKTASDGEREELATLGLTTLDYPIVSVYALHVALYALQDEGSARSEKALRLLSSLPELEGLRDADEPDYLLDVPEPDGWESA